MGHVFGDSTPFPYDINFIELIRQAVECGVALLAAQNDISTAVDRTSNFDQVRRNERARLDAMADAIKLSMTAFTSGKSERLQRCASRILEGARGIVEQEMVELEGQANTQLSSTRQIVEVAKERAFRTLESFLLRHDLPNTTVGVRLLAGDANYSGQALVATPFGIEAVFALAIPQAHQWGQLRRVAELSAGTQIHVPRESGFFSKRVEAAMVKLDKLFVTEVAIAPERSLVTLRKGVRSGSGFQLEVATEAQPIATLATLNEDGQPTGGPVQELDAEDAMHAMRLWQRVVDSTFDLAMRRQLMTSAAFDGGPLSEVDDPQSVCVRMINVLAPVVQEIGRRSGAPGELVLRRDAGEGRREEIYITKAELHERICTLPQGLRGVFDPFELHDGPRSPRAPAPSEPIYLESLDEDFVTRPKI